MLYELKCFISPFARWCMKRILLNHAGVDRAMAEIYMENDGRHLAENAGAGVLIAAGLGGLLFFVGDVWGRFLKYQNQPTEIVFLFLATVSFIVILFLTGYGLVLTVLLPGPKEILRIASEVKAREERLRREILSSAKPVATAPPPVAAGPVYGDIKCPACNGFGQRFYKDYSDGDSYDWYGGCTTCGGEGFKPVNIPPGQKRVPRNTLKVGRGYIRVDLKKYPKY